jgi:ribosomal protein L4
MKKKALCGAISLKAKSNVLFSLKAYTAKEVKTKDAANVLLAIGLKDQKVLLVLDAANELLEKSFRNIE